MRRNKRCKIVDIRQLEGRLESNLSRQALQPHDNGENLAIEERWGLELAGLPQVWTWLN